MFQKVRKKVKLNNIRFVYICVKTKPAFEYMLYFLITSDPNVDC